MPSRNAGPSLYAVAEAVALERLAPQRPGLAERFVRRRSGQEAFQILESALRPILSSTYGLLMYEEQLVEIAVRMAGFSGGGAEKFRREIAVQGDVLPGGSSRVHAAGKAVALAAWRIRFVRGAVERGLEVGRAEEVFAGLLTAGAITVSRAECVSEAMRLLRESRGFGAVRDGRAGSALPGITPLPLPRRQFVLPWLEAPAAAAAVAEGAQELPIRKRA